MNIDEAVETLVAALEIDESKTPVPQMHEIRTILTKALSAAPSTPETWDGLLSAVNGLKPNLRDALGADAHDLILAISPITHAISAKTRFPNIH